MNEVISIIKSRRQVFSLFFMALAMSAIVSCTSTEPPPTAEISSAERAIQDAEQARVTEYALPELQEARSKLKAAQQAVEEENMDKARRLLQQSTIYVELAFAKAELQKAQAVNEEMEKNLNILREEMNRKSGGVQ